MPKPTTIAVLADIHANWEALSAVLEDARARGATDYVCAGDIVGYNADPARCLDTVRSLTATIVQGNHDHYCSRAVRLKGLAPHAAEAIRWTRKQLSDEHKDFLGSLQRTAQVAGATLVHNTLAGTRYGWQYVLGMEDAGRHFAHQKVQACFHGHTHLPVVFEKTGDTVRFRRLDSLRFEDDKQYFVNVGSVGQPRDHDPRAAYALYDPAAARVTLRRVPYDIEATQAKIHAAGLPDVLALRLAGGM